MARLDREGPDPIDVAVGARIRLRRQARGMSQQALAEQLGVSFQQVQKYERGSNRISASMLVRTARTLECPAGALLEAVVGEPSAGQAQEDALQAELNGLLAQSGAVELLRAFAQVADAESRSGVIAVVRGLAAPGARAGRTAG